jgi:hypothetical protein
VYPLPTRVTYTREIDFDAQGRPWTSNSNAPAWQIEYGVPKVIRLEPEWIPTADPRSAAAVVPGSAAHRRTLESYHGTPVRRHGIDVDRLTKGR